jgi:hypothetical protein
MSYIALWTLIIQVGKLQIWLHGANGVTNSINLISRRHKTPILLQVYLAYWYYFMVLDLFFINNNSCAKEPVYHPLKSKKIFNLTK